MTPQIKEKVGKEDALMYSLAFERLLRYRAEATVAATMHAHAQKSFDAVSDEMKEKYGLANGDRWTDDGTIVRQG